MRKSLLLPIMLVCVLFVAIFLLFRQPPSWNGKSRFRLILGSESGNVSLLLFDPKRGEVREFPVPGDTQVEASFGLGQWKISSLWKLGIQEKKGGGVMLSQSLIRGYGLPVEGYIRYQGKADAFKLARSLVFINDTSLYFRDRLALAWFVLHARITEENDLTPQSIILTAEEVSALTDGIVTVSNTPDLTADQTKGLSILVSNLGGKILDFSTLTENQEQYCSVSGKSVFSEKLAKVLGCAHSDSNEETTYLYLGHEFVKNY